MDDGLGQLIRMEEHARGIGKVLKDAMPPGIGFALVLFSFGSDGWLTYLSNGEREDMIKCLEETLQKIKTSPHGTRN